MDDERGMLRAERVEDGWVLTGAGAPRFGLVNDYLA